LGYFAEGKGPAHTPPVGRIAMWRCLAIAVLLYAAGDARLDAYRPAAFERSLREFHRDVNRIGADAVRTAAGLDQVRALQDFSSLGARLQAMLPLR
jgi:hypothetical protein